jgi:hypothetical protein
MACSNEKHYSIVEESLIYIFQYNGHGQGRATCSSVPITACGSSAELPWPGKEGKLLFFECPNLFNMGSMHDSLENNLCYVHAGSHCIHGRTASRRLFCFINAPFHARKSTWKVATFSLNVCLCLCFVFCFLFLK